jgi:hypothetical protein
MGRPVLAPQNGRITNERRKNHDFRRKTQLLGLVIRSHVGATQFRNDLPNTRV